MTQGTSTLRHRFCGKALTPGGGSWAFRHEEHKEREGREGCFQVVARLVPRRFSCECATALLRALRDLGVLGVEMPAARPRTCPSGHEPGAVDSKSDAESPGRAKAPTQRFAATSMTQGTGCNSTPVFTLAASVSVCCRTSTRRARKTASVDPNHLFRTIHGARSGRLALAGGRPTTGPLPVKPFRQARPKGPRGSTSHTRRKKSNPPVISVDISRHSHYTRVQCQPRSTSPAFPPNPTKGLVHASSAGSAARCGASLSVASPSPVPYGARPRRKPAATTPRRRIRKPPRPRICVSRTGRAPLTLSRCFRRPSRVCSPPVVTAAPQPPAALHFSTRATCPSPRRHSPSSAPKPVPFSTRRSRTAIPRPSSCWYPRSSSTSIRSCRPTRASRIPRQRFPTCGTASAPRSLTPRPTRRCPQRRGQHQPPLRMQCRMRRSHPRIRRHRRPGCGQTTHRAPRRYRYPACPRPTSRTTPRSPPPHRGPHQTPLPRPDLLCTQAYRSDIAHNLPRAGAHVTHNRACRAASVCICVHLWFHSLAAIMPPLPGRPERSRAPNPTHVRTQ